jgi:hypothetical protein
MVKKMKILLLTGLYIVIGCGLLTTSAHALSFGDEIVIERVKDSNFFWSRTVTVSTDVEVEGRVHDIDFSPIIPEIAISFNLEGFFGDASVYNGFRFWDINETIDAFEDVSIFSTNMAGFDDSRVAFNDDNIYIDFEGLGFTSSTYVNLQLGDTIVGFSRGLDPAAVPTPEPGTMILMGSGLLGLAGFGRRKLKRLK